MKVIHHNDPDGVCAAALIGIKYPNETIEYIAMDYYKKISFDLFVKDETDLIKDLVSIITSFCCRLYGLRRGQNKALKLKQELLKEI